MGSRGPIYDSVPEIKGINMVWEDPLYIIPYVTVFERLTEEYDLSVPGYITKPITTAK